MTLVLPLYYDFDDLHDSRTTVLVPLFVRHHRARRRHDLWLAPLFYRRTSPGRFDHGRVSPVLGLQATRTDRTTHGLSRSSRTGGADLRRRPTSSRPTTTARAWGPTAPTAPTAGCSSPFSNGGQAPRRLYVGGPGRPLRPRAHRPQPLPEDPLHDLRDRGPRTPDLLVQPAVRTPRRQATRGLSANVW